MIKFDKTEVIGWEAAIRGMRNPYNSWSRSDSGLTCPHGEYKMGYERCSSCIKDNCNDKPYFVIGQNDFKLMMDLAKAGPTHAKYRRMIIVYVDITAPLYWWKEFDTYKVGTVTNSCSTMHKIHDKEFTLDDFSTDHLDDVSLDTFNYIIAQLEYDRKLYLKTKVKPMKDESKRAELMKKYWWQVIQLLPSTYNQRRTVMINYEVLNNIYHTRRYHKLDEWKIFCKWIETLPYSSIITLEEKVSNDDCPGPEYEKVYGK